MLRLVALLVGVVIALSGAACAHMSPSRGTSPNLATSDDRALREFRIRGLSLGMTRQEASAILANQGFVPDDAVWFRRDVNGEAHGGWEWIRPVYVERSGRDIVFSIWFKKRISGTLDDEPLRRQAVEQEVGSVRLWHRDQRGPNWTDEFVVAESTDDELQVFNETAKACFWVWGCVSVRENIDCRPIVNRNRRVMLDGWIDNNGQLEFELTDYDLLADDLFGDARFRERDLTGLGCAVPSIH